jgi:hypothetical protein
MIDSPFEKLTAATKTPLREGREMKMTFTGWICADLKDAVLLESMGVVLGEYDDLFGTFENCVASETALAHLSPCWGEFIWDLKPVEALDGEVKKSDATAKPVA